MNRLLVQSDRIGIMLAISAIHCLMTPVLFVVKAYVGCCSRISYLVEIN